MDVKISRKTAGTLIGAGVGGVSAFALANDASTVTMHLMQLDWPAEPLAAASRIVTAVWSLAIAGGISVIGRFVSPKPAEPAIEREITTDVEYSKVVPGA